MNARTALREFRVLVGFGFREAPAQAALFLVCGAIMALASPALAYGAKLLIDAASAGQLTPDLFAALFLSLIVAFSLINGLAYVDLLFTVVEKAGAALDQSLMRLIGGIPGIAHHESPDYLDRLDLLREHRSELAWMTNATAGLLRVAVQLVASEILLARLAPILLALPLFGVISFALGKRARDLQMQAREQSIEPERLCKHLFDLTVSPSAGQEVRIFALADAMLHRHHAASHAVNQARDRAEWQSAGLQAVDAVVFGLAYVGAIGLVLSRALHGQATPGDVILVVGLAAGMNGMVATAVGYGTHFLSVLRVAGWYLWLADYAEAATPVPAEPIAVPPRLATGLELQNVSFSYPGHEKAILTNVSLRLPAGSVVALVGENGAGKTTLVKLLARFYEPTAGQILVDGRDLQRMPVDAWRTRLSGAFQDFCRFEFRLRETVGVGDLPRLDDSLAVAKAVARAGAEAIPEALPRGFETQLGKAWDGGVDLSGGQWQKLALSRALMREAPLLIVFDEPTAALDPPTEHALFERFAEAARRESSAGTITLLVTHRFSTIGMADLIVVLDQGRIVEQGSHAELLQLDGLYAELYQLQSRGYQ